MAVVTPIGANDPAWLSAWRARMHYADRGRGPRGYDCWGCVHHFYAREYGIELPDYTDRYASARADADVAALITREARTWRCLWRRHRGEADPPAATIARQGDVIVCAIWTRPSHVGVALDGDRFLHVLNGCQACVERMSATPWARCVSGIYRHRALEGGHDR